MGINDGYGFGESSPQSYISDPNHEGVDSFWYDRPNPDCRSTGSGSSSVNSIRNSSATNSSHKKINLEEIAGTLFAFGVFAALGAGTGMAIERWIRGSSSGETGAWIGGAVMALSMLYEHHKYSKNN